MKRYYSLRELSQELNIPKSTIVKYKDFFGEYLPMLGEGKRKKFDESAVQVLTLVRQLREVENRDWMEIRDALAERYGAKRTDAPPVAVAVPSDAVGRRMDHLTHILMALAGEVIHTREALGELAKRVQRSDGSSRRADALAQQMGQVQTDMRRVAGETQILRDTVVRHDAKNKRRLESVLAQVRADLMLMSRGIAQASSAVPAGPSPETMKALVAKIQAWMQEHSALQTRYMMLLQENELLKTRIREIDAAPPAASPAALAAPQSAAPRPQRIFGRIRKEAGRK